MILLIDNYDSFVYNLARYAQELGHEVAVYRNDCLTLKQIERLNPDHIVISPGPCTPDEAGVSNQVVQHFGTKIPILGVCLGHQCIGKAFGGDVIRAQNPMHGKTSMILHKATGIFRDLPDPLRVTRYHSLVVANDNLPDCLEVTATSMDDEIMAFSHKELPIVGVQFHPEAILTHCGYDILRNFLNGDYR
jgi:anthranilate synthase/aminodeoxychorismate synthase-like glutamine amidotransferase